MKYNKSELIARAEKATIVETYEYTGKNHRIHTDTVKYIGNSNFDKSEIEDLPYDENGEVDVDVQLMEREDYETTILANCSSSWKDMYADDDKILVIVVKDRRTRYESDD